MNIELQQLANFVLWLFQITIPKNRLIFSGSKGFIVQIGCVCVCVCGGGGGGGIRPKHHCLHTVIAL